ncbi:MAG: hypothetical protein AAB410_03290 [Patescibacteria group bacterium]
MRKSYIPSSAPHENPEEPVLENAEEVIRQLIFPNKPDFTLDEEFKGGGEKKRKN